MEFTFLKEPKTILLILVNAPMFYIYYKIIFGDLSGLVDSFRQSGQIDAVSYFKGTLLDDWWHTAKIIVWLLACYKTVKWEYNYFFISS